jgi:hypothetical protein
VTFRNQDFDIIAFMRSPSFASLLAGGDRRSIGKSNHVAAAVLRRPASFPKLLQCMWSDDPLVSMRAADAVEKVSISRPDLLRPFWAELLGLAEETSQQELRWHMALIMPRLQLAASSRKRAVETLRRYLDDKSSIVKTCAIQALAELSFGNPAMEEEMVELLEHFRVTGTAAMKARSRKLLQHLQKNKKFIG